MTKTMVDLDDDALREAQAVLGTSTKKETINRALGEVVARAHQAQAVAAQIERGRSGFYRRLLDDDLSAVLER
jgi:Arc/MetJ family transcription regulator